MLEKSKALSKKFREEVIEQGKALNVPAGWIGIVKFAQVRSSFGGRHDESCSNSLMLKKTENQIL